MAGDAAIHLDVDARDTSSGAAAALNRRLGSINARAAAGREPFERLARNYGEFRRLTGLDTIAGGLGAVARSGYAAFRSVMAVVEPLAALAGAASVAGMVKLALAWSSFGTRLGQTATRAGLTAEQLGTLENAARLAGVEQGSMSSGLVALKDNLTNAGGGRAPEVVGMFQALGVSFRDAAGHMRSTTDLLPELADKIAGMADPTLQARAATALFGGAGEAMLPFLRRGSAGIAEYTAKARSFGVMNDAGVAAANRLREAQESLGLAVEGLGNTVAERLAPVLVPLLQQLADWIARNREWIGTKVAERVGAFADWMRGIDWGAMADRVGSIAHGADAVAQALGGWKKAAEAVLLFIAGVWLTRMLASIGVAAAALGRLPGGALRGAAALVRRPGVAAGLGVMGFELYEALGAGSTHAAEPVAGSGRAAAGPRAGGGDAAVGGTDVRTGMPAGASAGWADDMRQLQGYGWTRDQAAGILGNLDQESGGNAHATGDGGHAYGLGQWHEDRQATFAQQFGHDIRQSTRSEQVAFTNWELNNTEKSAGRHLRQAANARDSAAAVRRYYERPADRDGKEDGWRGDRAEKILAGTPPAPAGAPVQLAEDAGTSRAPGGAGSSLDGSLQVGVTVRGAPGTQARATQTGDGMEPLQLRQAPVGVM